MELSVVYEAPDDLTVGDMMTLLRRLSTVLPGMDVSYRMVSRDPEDPVLLDFNVDTMGASPDLMVVFEAAASVAPRRCPVRFPKSRDQPEPTPRT